MCVYHCINENIIENTKHMLIILIKYGVLAVNDYTH